MIIAFWTWSMIPSTQLLRDFRGGNLPCNDQGKKEDRLLTARQERLSVEMTTKISANVFLLSGLSGSCAPKPLYHSIPFYTPVLIVRSLCLKGLRRWPLVIQLCSLPSLVLWQWLRFLVSTLCREDHSNYSSVYNPTCWKLHWYQELDVLLWSIDCVVGVAFLGSFMKAYDFLRKDCLCQSTGIPKSNQ